MPIFEAIKIFMRLFICTFFLFFTYNTSPAQTKIAVKGGATFSTARVYVGSEKQDTKINAGYGMGILFKVPFEGVLHFSPWVAYNRRGMSTHLKRAAFRTTKTPSTTLIWYPL